MHETNLTYQKDFIPKCNLFLTMWGSWTGEWLAHVHYMDKSSGAARETKAMFGVWPSVILKQFLHLQLIVAYLWEKKCHKLRLWRPVTAPSSISVSSLQQHILSGIFVKTDGMASCFNSTVQTYSQYFCPCSVTLKASTAACCNFPAPSLIFPV